MGLCSFPNSSRRRASKSALDWAGPEAPSNRFACGALKTPSGPKAFFQGPCSRFLQPALVFSTRTFFQNFALVDPNLSPFNFLGQESFFYTSMLGTSMAHLAHLGSQVVQVGSLQNPLWLDLDLMGSWPHPTWCRSKAHLAHLGSQVVQVLTTAEST